MILPAVARPSAGLTPVSMTATSIPAPVYPAAHQARTPVYVVVLYMELTSVTGSYGPAARADPGRTRAAPGNPTGRMPASPRDGARGRRRVRGGADPATSTPLPSSAVLMRFLAAGRSLALSPRIPGFASPPLDGFAVLQTDHAGDGRRRLM